MKLSRRRFLHSSLLTLPILDFLAGSEVFAQNETLSPIPKADLQKIGLDAFSDEELDLPYYVAHFHALANSVRMEGENKGFFDLSVWRRAEDNKPYNARIMENVLSLAYFYGTDRPWNVFRGLPALRERLEAALRFWCDSQGSDGRFREYSEKGYNLAATAFATKYMGETLWLLTRPGVDIDPELLDRVRKCDRKAIMAVLTRKKMHEAGKTFSNQFANVYGGGLAYIDVFPDKEMKERLDRFILQCGADFQSPVGYFYEKGGPDWSYNLGTHQGNLKKAYFYAKGTDLGRVFLEEERQFVDWFSYNAVREPDGNAYILNKAVETRQSVAFWRGFRNDVYSRFLRESTPLAAAFSDSKEEFGQWQKKTREELRKNWPKVARLRQRHFSAFAPGRFLHRRDEMDIPTAEEKKRAVALLPYLKSDNWTQQRLDSRVPTCFTFVRRPGYYLIFNSGKKGMEKQRFGIGLIWTPEYGTFLQSPSGVDGQSWGTCPTGKNNAYESRSFTPTFLVDGKEIAQEVGIRDIGIPDGGRLKIRYGLDAKRKSNNKSIVFADRSVDVSVRFKGAFAELFPLLIDSEESLSMEEDKIVLRSGTKPVVFSFRGARKIESEPLRNRIATKRLYLVRVEAVDTLDYSIANAHDKGRQ